MPNTDVRGVHLDAHLTNLSRLYQPSGFVADTVCPRIGVAKESDLYVVWDRGPFFGAGDDVDTDLLGDRSPVRRVDVTYSREGYMCEERALGFDISPRERANADSVLRLEANKMRAVQNRLALLRERRVATILQDTGQTGGELDASTDAASAARWDDASTTYQNIRGDIAAAVTRVRQETGVRPNTIVIPAAVAEGLEKTTFYSAAAGPLIVYDGNPTGPAYSDFPRIPSTLLGLRVLIAGAIRDTAAEGGSFTDSEVWGETVRVLYVTSGAALEEPSVAYTFQSQSPAVRRWQEDDPQLDVFKVSNGVIDEKVVAPLAAATITNCLT